MHYNSIQNFIITYCLILLFFHFSLTLHDYNLNRNHVDKVTLLEKKLTPIRKMIPDHLIIDYIRDVPDKNLPLNDDVLFDFFLAQYVMTPNIIALIKDQDQIVIGNYRFKGVFPEFKHHNFKLIKNVKNGLAIYLRKNK